MQFIETINVKGTEYQLQATYDSQGNDIAATYAKFTEVEGAISQAIGNLIGQAPEALNTLEELSKALSDDSNFAATMAGELGKKADVSNTYSKSEVDSIQNKLEANITGNVNNLSAEILKKADKESVYTKTETYTKDEVNNIADTKANASESYKKDELYTKSEIDELFALKSELHEIPENVSDFNNDAGYLVDTDIQHLAVAETVNTALDGKVDKVEGFELIASASAAKIAALPTVEQYNEKMSLIDQAIAAMGANVDNAINTNASQKDLIQANTEALENKVDKEDGKGLSTNDYTTDEKNLLAELATKVAELKAKIAELEALHAESGESEGSGEE